MINTTLCYIEKDGKYLMIHRVKKQNDMNKDKWIGIGGKFEPGESPFDCVRREVSEETGLTITPIYKGVITFVSNEFGTEYLHLFKAVEFSFGKIISVFLIMYCLSTLYLISFITKANKTSGRS